MYQHPPAGQCDPQERAARAVSFTVLNFVLRGALSSLTGWRELMLHAIRF